MILIPETVQEVKDISLNIHIDHKNPMELVGLTETLLSISKEYEMYAATQGFTEEDRHAKLYVREIKSGSTIVDLIEFASAGAIPFLENVNTIAGFAEAIKLSIDLLLDSSRKDKTEIKDDSLNNLSKIVAPVAKDNSAQLNIGTVVNGDLNYFVNLSSRDSKVLQEVIRREKRRRSIPEETEVIENTLMTLYQARGDVGSKVGNSAVVPEFDDKPHRVRFANTDLKEKILKGEGNPFNLAFVVDVKPEMVKKNKVIYFVLELHEIIDLDDINHED